MTSYKACMKNPNLGREILDSIPVYAESPVLILGREITFTHCSGP